MGWIWNNFMCRVLAWVVIKIRTERAAAEYDEQVRKVIATLNVSDEEVATWMATITGLGVRKTNHVMGLTSIEVANRAVVSATHDD